MNIAFFSTQPYDKLFFDRFNQDYGFTIEYFETPLTIHGVEIIKTATAVCVFVNDQLTEGVIEVLWQKGVKIIALRCAGFNNIDLSAAKRIGMAVCRVPAYSPQAVAEHAIAMLLTINRKTHKAYNRVREQNFSLNGLLGYNLFGKTIGVIGTGKIGRAFVQIMLGFGCKILAYDIAPDWELETQGTLYVPLDDLLRLSDIVSLHCPLTKDNHHLLNEAKLAVTKPGVTIINTSRGGLINTVDMINALKTKQVGALCIDVYEQEEHLFFRDLSANIIDDDIIQRLMSFPNVLITAHQAFFTQEAMTEIAKITLNNIRDLEQNLLPVSSSRRLA
jgi:D-lactate dehydrogenase